MHSNPALGHFLAKKLKNTTIFSSLNFPGPDSEFSQAALSSFSALHMFTGSPEDKLNKDYFKCHSSPCHPESQNTQQAALYSTEGCPSG